MSKDPEVVIIGAGPVGLSAALALGRSGIECLVLERRDAFSRYPKANGVHARTMEIFREWGVVEAVRELTAGEADEVTIAWRTRFAGIEIGELSMGGDEELSKSYDEQSPERMSAVGQHMFEPVLADVAGAMESVTIRLGCPVTDIKSTDDAVTVSYTDEEGKECEVTAAYVIAADGVRSIAREVLDIGEHGQESLGAAINVQFDADLDQFMGDSGAQIIWVLNPDTQGAFIKDGGTRWRYNIEMAADTDREAMVNDQERCEEAVKQAIGKPVDFKVDKIWAWTHDQAVTDRWRDGRVFLAGDCAHRFPPHGGFGMNSGIQDAQNIVWKLIARLRWNAGDGLLETYESERLPVAEFNGERMMHNTRQMEQTGFMMQDKDFLAKLETDEGKPFRDMIAFGIKSQVEQLLSAGQQFGFQYEGDAIVEDGTEKIESGVSKYRPSARPGARAPHSWVQIDGKRGSTIDVYNGDFILLTGPDNAGWVTGAEQASKELGVPIKTAGLGSDLLPDGESIDDLLGRYGIEPSGAVLIRPDGFVGFRAISSDGSEQDALEGALKKILDRA